MRVSFIFVLLHEVIVTTMVSGSHDSDVKCQSCSAVTSPLLCQTTESCGLDEICYTREYFDHNKQRMFRMGCENKRVCDVLANGNVLIGRRGESWDEPTEGTSLCFSCCSADYCNLEMCLDETYVNKTDTSHSGHHNCLPGFVKGPNSCLYFATWKEAWTNARTGCREFGADLVKIDNQAEDLFIVSQIKKLKLAQGADGYWIGGHLDKASNTWRWTDGSPVNYTRWGPGEPDHGQPYIALVDPAKWYSNWDWADHGVPGYAACGYICERPFSA